MILSKADSAHVQIVHVPGRDASAHARSVWQMLPMRLQRLVLFDVPFEKRPEVLEAAWGTCPHVLAAIYQHKPVAFAWATPMGGTGECHFIMPALPPDMAILIVSRLLQESARFFKALLCLFPMCFRSLRRLIAFCGFRFLTRLPHVCWLALHNRWVDGGLYLYEGCAWQ